MKHATRIRPLELRERGYRQLAELLARPIYHRWPEQAEDIRQQTLLVVFERFAQCQSPITFHAFALNKMRGVAQQMFRKSRKEEPWGDRDVTAPDQFAAVTIEQVTEECRKALQRAIEALQEVARKLIILKYSTEPALSDEAIAGRLGLTPVNVRVTRFRTLRQLRNNPELQECMDQYNEL
jgi:RNA polymerase sigma factor (sigma-70 family)